MGPGEPDGLDPRPRRESGSISMSQDTIVDVSVTLTNNGCSERRVSVLSIVDGTAKRRTVRLESGELDSVIDAGRVPIEAGPQKVYVEIGGGVPDVKVTALVRRERPDGSDDTGVEIVWDSEPRAKADEKWFAEVLDTDVDVGVEDAPSA